MCIQAVCVKCVKDECCVQNPKYMNIYNLLFLLALPQYAAIMQEPSIGRPICIRVVCIIIEVGVVSGLAI